MKARIREFRHAVPFRPFIIRMADGREFYIERPDFVMASPNNKSWVVVEEVNEDRMHYLSPSLIAGVEPASDLRTAP